MFNIRYPLGKYSPELFKGRSVAYVHCEVGAMLVIGDQAFTDHHIQNLGTPYVINWSNSGISDLHEGSTLWSKLSDLQNNGYQIEIFQNTLFALWSIWESDKTVTIDGLRITKLQM